MRLENVVLPNAGPIKYFNIDISDESGKVENVTQLESRQPSPSSLILPTLCHPHIHLDKAYLLTSHPKNPGDDEYPDYSDLALESGDFQEALSKTSEAKTRYTIPDLILRGSQLIAESIQAGVTAMRAFVEIDHVTKFKCLEAAVELKQKFNHLCHIQICAFAQDPVMSTHHGAENRRLMDEALEKYRDHIEVLGTTPYVESSFSDGVENMRWAIETAMKKNLHLDFHLDYNVSSGSKPMVWDAVEILKKAKWGHGERTRDRIVIGHCTRVTLFSDEDMKRLATQIAGLPVAFVGLPTSDLFMMGRPDKACDGYGRRERGTLQVIDMIQKNGLNACIGVNNAGNAFTPWGGADPLRLASLGVGVYQAGTVEHAKILYECVSIRARRAIGLLEEKNDANGKPPTDLDFGDFQGGILVIENEASIGCTDLTELVPARQRLKVTDIVWDPPELRLRKVIRKTNIKRSAL